MDSGFTLIFLGFSLGLVHALDADHVMAVSALSNGPRRGGVIRTLRFCLNWALGHGFMLLLAGLMLFGLGIELSPELQQLAEQAVGVFLILVGVRCFWSFRSKGVRLSTHRHQHTVHTHWHQEGDVDFRGHRSAEKTVLNGHEPVMVGALHGLAGSAPVLAMLPALGHDRALYSLSYLLLFSVGVMLSMLCFGSGLGCFQKWLQRWNLRLFESFRYSVASFSILFGAFWLIQAA